MWCHGCSQSHINPLCHANRTVSALPSDMDTALADCFFPGCPLPLPVSLQDDPPPLPSHPFTPITPSEISAALARSSNSSAPGPSSLNYKLIK
jgi:hypothetical protein